MPDLQTAFGYRDLTQTVQQFRFPNFWLVNQVPSESVDGTVASWDIERPRIDLDTNFTTLGGEAQPVAMGTYGNRTQAMPITFKFMTLDPSKLMQARIPGTTMTRASGGGRFYVQREQSSIQRRFGAYLEEYMLWKALTGTLTITISGISTAIDYGLAASHKPTSASSWTSTSYNLLPDLTEWKRIIRKDSGMEPRWALCNQVTMNYLMANQYVANLMGNTMYGVQLAEQGYITKFHGLTWVVLDHHYAQPGAIDRFDTPFIADGKVFILPDITSEWIALQRGIVPIPNLALNDVIEAVGPVMWSRVTDSPTGLTLYYKNARLPVIRLPGAICYATVV